MFASITQKLKGWKTIIFARFLVGLGALAGIIYPLLQLVNGDQIGVFIPPKYTPLIPLIVAVIGMVNEGLRRVTTGPVGSKGEVAATPQTKAGD
jgi:hypothetical protein